MSGEAKSGWVTLAASRTSGPVTHPGYQRAGTYDRPGMKASERLQSFVLRHIAHHYAGALAAGRPPRFAVIQGPPGEGKTEAVRVSCSRHGVDVIVVAPSEFAGETENAGPLALARLGEAVLAITAQERRPILVLLDDGDLTIAARLGSTEYTVDSQLLTGVLQHLADNGTLKTAQGSVVPIVMTGNNFSPMRNSLLRPGRAVFFEHVLSLDEKSEIVARIFDTNEYKRVRQLVSAYRKEPIAFFAALRSQASDERLDLLIARDGLNIAAIESELRNCGSPVDFAYLHKLAAAASAGRAKSYL